VRFEVDPPRKGQWVDLVFLVIESRDLVRHGVRLTIERAGAEVVAPVSDVTRALVVARSLQPDIVILSATPPDMSAAQAISRLRALVPHCQILVLGGAEEDEMVLEALAEGASGHLPTLTTPEELLTRVSLARAGGVMLSQGVAGKLWERLRTPPTQESPPDSLDVGALSGRELEVLQLLPTGMDNADIARVLSISPTTVKKHVSSILEKLQLDNRVQAAVRAVRAGLEAPVPR
jgi:DNA-binding NarL/FixJ family response regulator